MVRGFLGKVHEGTCQLKGLVELCMFSKLGGKFGESMRFGSSTFS